MTHDTLRTMLLDAKERQRKVAVSIYGEDGSFVGEVIQVAKTLPQAVFDIAGLERVVVSFNLIESVEIEDIVPANRVR